MSKSSAGKVQTALACMSLIGASAGVTRLALYGGPSSSAPPAAAYAATAQTRACTVTSITDGDTFRCGEERIRLLGMDTPERGQGEAGRAATAALASMLPVGSEARLEIDVQPTDRYGRTLAYVYARDGRMVNEELVREGWAVLLTYPPNIRYVERFGAAQERARRAGVGLWRSDGFACLPRDYRRHRCR